MCTFLNLNNNGSLLVYSDHGIVVSSSEQLQGCTVAPLQHGHAEAETHHKVRLPDVTNY